jgi:hypothetical protein
MLIYASMCRKIIKNQRFILQCHVMILRTKNANEHLVGVFFFCVFMLIGWCLLAFSLFRALVFFCHIVCLGAAIISLPKKMLLSILQLLGFGVH